MKIATYNVRNLYDAGTFIDDKATVAVDEGFFNKRVEHFTAIFKELDLDIICLQEIGGEMGVEKISEALLYDFFIAKPNKRGIRMAVLYKKSLAASVTCESVSFGELSIPSIQVRGDTTALPPLEQRRDILEITLQTSGKTIVIDTFHLKSNLPQWLPDDDTENDANAYTEAKMRCVYYKTMEMSAIRKHVNGLLQNGNEVILLGDYNENNTASIMDILKGSQKEELRLDDVLVGYQGDKTTHIHRGNRLTFDTVLISQGLKEKIESIAVKNESLRDHSQLPWGTIENEVESDHALVMVTLKDIA